MLASDIVDESHCRHLAVWSEHLLRDSTATEARHGFIVNYAASGNVFRDVRIVRSRFADDSHRFLAHANLYDRVVLESGWLQAVNRGTTSTGAGFTASLQSLLRQQRSK